MVSPVLDTHQHVWDLSRAEYSWLGPDAGELNRTIAFDELKPSLKRAGIHGTVLVESADNAEDTDLMFDTAAHNPEVVAIVAFVPLDRPAEAAVALERLRESTLTVGIRNLIHNQADPEWLLGREVSQSLGMLEDAGLTFDLVSVLPRHLELVPILSERFPRLRMVIDHLSKPPIGLDSTQPWWDLIAAAAENPLVYGKVSGLYAATANPEAWTVDAVRPYVDHAMDVFGARRLMYGGDWPISLTAGGYDRVWEGLTRIFDGFSADERTAILGATGVEFYGIDESRIDAAIARSSE
ncbi:amidohydrolase family protein [Parafrigoribacterium soli]|uniref:amidohydrolase family protein n=1 Tax=Parafrigoribacterium soli TaxID=3144663 RepID=UPI0032ED5A2E